jgi:hypothetical protein
METYLDVILSTNGEKASVIHKKLLELGLKPTIGEHEYVYKWEGLADFDEEMELIDKIQNTLKDTGVMLKFTSVR